MTKNRIGAFVFLVAGLASAAPATPANPLLEPWTGPYGGVPPFDRVKVEQFEPAFEVAMEENRREIAAILRTKEAPTFENTIAVLEDAGRTFNRVYEVYNAWSTVMNTPDFQQVEHAMAPRLAAFWDEQSQDLALFQRIQAVHDSPEMARLTPEQRRLVQYYYRDFARSGVKLDAPGRKRIAELNQRLAALYTSFKQNVLADEANAVIIDNEADLAGLPEALRKAGATDAEARGLKGRWVVSNTRSAVADFLTYLDNRALREKVWRNYDSRGDHGDAHDNNAIVSEILALRAEQARLLGYPTYAHRQLEGTMVATPERALKLLMDTWAPSVAQVRADVAGMRALAQRSGLTEDIAPWDYRYFAEKVRKAKYDFDDNEVKPYLQLEKLREGMFWVAGELFGYTFAPAVGVPVYHPDVRVFEVKERASGRHVGLLYFDPYARQGKYNGGQTDPYRIQERFRGEVTPIVSNSMPFVKPGPGEVALVGWRDAQTLFHEFGHALHELSSNVAYPSLSGGRVVRDYAEFPGKLLERWVATPEVLERFAVHHKTGKPMPPALLAKIQKAATFNQGFYLVDFLTSALVEMKLHLAKEQPLDPDAFERDTLQQLGAPAEVGMRFRMPHFGHVFASNAYAAGYYTYLWADVLAADAFEAFRQARRLHDPKLAARLRQHVFSVGNTVDPFEGYRAFRGRDATSEALMRERGIR
ncbi:M3 family metallopeptidase [Vitiosangium sp. GDMCC 1.1324]|uniref:M3 family metallopeptidase n=1 Tax=Vitiosangium sp. (strain GDMCC 1.1324) TaxID=2138576 RepID=UPI000D38AE89|nr:M3 family metallopeptidase [Vitiosangium sp. GDMCC 1.1324]PTL74950.1 peptidase M3 [Vitiosangium sp. GDMCC 1.1324]